VAALLDGDEPAFLPCDADKFLDARLAAVEPALLTGKGAQEETVEITEPVIQDGVDLAGGVFVNRLRNGVLAFPGIAAKRRGDVRAVSAQTVDAGGDQ
jgi:hypothetical protein